MEQVCLQYELSHYWSTYADSEIIPFTVLQNILDPNDKITVNNKKFTIAIKDGLPLVYTPAGGNRQPHEELWYNGVKYFHG